MGDASQGRAKLPVSKTGLISYDFNDLTIGLPSRINPPILFGMRLVLLGFFFFALSGTAAPRLVEGSPAPEADFPFVFIWTAETEIDEGFCTASKVGPALFLTAAHCVLDQEENTVRYQPYKRGKISQPGTPILYSFSKLISAKAEKGTAIIKGVSFPPLVDKCLSTEIGCDHGRVPLPDVALVELTLDRDSRFSKAPSAPVDFNLLTPGTPITILGYGAQEDKDTLPPQLKFHPMNVATETELVTALKGTDADLDGLPNWEYFFGTLGPLVNKQFAGLGRGDSGGPVLKGGTHIVGINSDGYCPLDNLDCERSSNSTFARVNKASSHGVGEWLSRLLLGNKI